MFLGGRVWVGSGFTQIHYSLPFFIDELKVALHNKLNIYAVKLLQKIFAPFPHIFFLVKSPTPSIKNLDNYVRCLKPNIDQGMTLCAIWHS